MTNTKISFVGCSFTTGVGLTSEKTDPGNYTNITKHALDADVRNLSKTGNSNYNIFISGMKELAEISPDILVIQWSGLNRLWVYPTPESELFLSHQHSDDFKCNNLFFSKKQLQTFSDTFHMLNHDYNSILTLIDYCNLLNKMSRETKIVFMNGLLPWTMDMFDAEAYKNPFLNFSEYTKEILDFEHKDDVELQKLFLTLSNKLSELDKSQWVNIDKSMLDMIEDRGSDNSHPGYKSHKRYADMLINHLTT